MIYTFETPEFFDKALFKHFIRMLRDAGVVDTDEAGKLSFDESVRLGRRQRPPRGR